MRGVDARLRALERQSRERGRGGELLPIAVLHPTMIEALFTPEERASLVYRATEAELEQWGRLRGATAHQTMGRI